MKLFSWFWNSLVGGKGHDGAAEQDVAVNPASGLPMVNQSIDVAGNSFGTREDLNKTAPPDNHVGSGFFDTSFGDLFGNDNSGSGTGNPFDPF